MWVLLPRAASALRAPASIPALASARVAVSHVATASRAVNTIRPFSIASYLLATEATATTVKRVTREAAATVKKTGTTTTGRKRPGAAAAQSAAGGGTAKAKAKPKAKPKKKAAAKPKPKPKKKVLTPEEKRRRKVSELRKVALVGQEPKKLPEQIWLVYTTRALKGAPGGLGLLENSIKSVSASYHALAPHEVEALKTQAHNNKAANRVALRNWLETHTAEEIHIANKARRRLKTLQVRSRQLSPIVDERIPKRNVSSYILFVRSKWAHNHYSGSVVDTAREMGAEWRALSASEKQPFIDLALSEKEHYLKEFAKLATDS